MTKRAILHARFSRVGASFRLALFGNGRFDCLGRIIAPCPLFRWRSRYLGGLTRCLAGFTSFDSRGILGRWRIVLKGDSNLLLRFMIGINGDIALGDLSRFSCHSTRVKSKIGLSHCINTTRLPSKARAVFRMIY